MAFRVGQKVVCVDDTVHEEWHVPGYEYTGCLDGLKSGQIYTIRDIGYSDFDRAMVVRLEEIKRPDDGLYEESPYRAERFRPIVEGKTDTGMVILRKLLTDTKIKEKA